MADDTIRVRVVGEKTQRLKATISGDLNGTNILVQHVSLDGVGITNGNLDVHVADVHKTLINRYIVNFSGITSNLAVSSSVGATSLPVVSDAAFTVNDWISITQEGTEEPNFLKITAKPGANVLTLDRPLDNEYTVGDNPAVVEIVQPNIATAAGSLSVPVSFKLIPFPGEIFHITRLLLAAESTSESSINEFLSLAALTNGVVIREFRSGIYHTRANWKKDADLIEDMFDLNPVPKPPAGKFGQRGRWTFKKAGNFIYLDGNEGDYLEVLVQDSLSGATLEDFQIKAQGHLQE